MSKETGKINLYIYINPICQNILTYNQYKNDWSILKFGGKKFRNPVSHT